MHLLRLISLVALLAGLDIVAAIALKEAHLRREPMLALAGVAIFVALAVLLYYALELSDLTLVSLGWIVVYQVVIVGVDYWLYDTRPGRLQLSAVAVALVATIVAALAGPAPAEPVAPIPRPRHEDPIPYIAPGSGSQEDRDQAGPAGVQAISFLPAPISWRRG